MLLWLNVCATDYSSYAPLANAVPESCQTEFRRCPNIHKGRNYYGIH